MRLDEHLPRQRQFLIDGGILGLAASTIRAVCGAKWSPDERRAVGVLTALHELAHEVQGIAEKDAVSRVRFAGAESALMHVDLGADHLAALAANAVFPAWELAWLKDLHGRSLAAFPAGHGHPQFARVRKTLRLVGLRLDLALRRAGWRWPSESYAFADFSPGGGSFVVLVNRPPFVVVKSCSIDAAAAAILFDAVEGAVGAVERVDRVIALALGATRLFLPE